MEIVNLTYISDIIITACVLHNYLIDWANANDHDNGYAYDDDNGGEDGYEDNEEDDDEDGIEDDDEYGFDEDNMEDGRAVRQRIL